MGEKERLALVMEKEQVTAKEFAEQIGVSPATISNIMQGRNNPSLEVIQKVLHRYRALSTDWLLFESGPMYREKGKEPQPTLFDERPVETHASTASVASTAQSHYVERVEVPRAQKIQKILICYEDGTFTEIKA